MSWAARFCGLLIGIIIVILGGDLFIIREGGMIISMLMLILVTDNCCSSSSLLTFLSNDFIIADGSSDDLIAVSRSIFTAAGVFRGHCSAFVTIINSSIIQLLFLLQRAFTTTTTTNAMITSTLLTFIEFVHSYWCCCLQWCYTLPLQSPSVRFDTYTTLISPPITLSHSSILTTKHCFLIQSLSWHDGFSLLGSSKWQNS